VALEGSYHGRTFGAMSLTGQEKYRKGFEPMLENVTFVAQNNIEALHAAVNANTCAIVLEPIFGEGGILECSEEFLLACRTLADHYHAALIFDEIQCGLGRTGKIFAFQSFGITPDIVAIAKPIAAGVPLGAFLSKNTSRPRFLPGSTAPRLAEDRLPAASASNIWRSWKKSSCSKMSSKLAATCISRLQELVDKYAAPGKRAAADSFRAWCSIFPRGHWWSRDWRRECSST
jgi:acetylornithine/N-succinyldiaminopimelate aminotransferase